MQLAVALAAFIVSSLTALFVFKKNPRSGTNLYFSLLVFLIGVYPLCNHLALQASTDAEALLWAKAILFVSIPQGPLLYFFARTFPDTKFIFKRRQQYFILAWVTINIVFAAAGLIFKQVVVKDGTVSIVPGPLVPSFGLMHAGTIIAGLVFLALKYRHSYGKSRRQLAFVFYGVLVSFSLTFLITFILPVILKNTVLLAISPLILTLSVVLAAYAIIAQRLFNIQAAVARSAGYSLALATSAIIYILVAFGVSSIFFGEHSLFSDSQLAYTMLALAVAFTFNPIRRLFGRLTTRLFYQDAYDTQDLLNRLNRELVATIEVDQLLAKTLALLERSLKIEHGMVMLSSQGSGNDRVVATSSEPLSEEDLGVIKSKMSSQYGSARIIVTDELGSDERTLRDTLIRSNIAFLMKMSGDFGHNNKVTGYIILGQKKSGNPYSKQDVAAMEIITNELVIAIQNALRFEEIQHFNVTLQEKIDEATKKLRKTNERLRLLDQTKDDFISMASHQLRTPLTSVKGYVSMVLDGDGGKISEIQRKLLTQSFVSAQRMVYLISDLLNVSRLKTGKFLIEPVESDLAKVVDEELGQLTETIKSRNLHLTFNKPQHFPSLMLDETKIRQVIMNFVDNAIYYTPSGGEIEVRLEEKPESVEFTVTDNGIGVPKHEQHHLFDKFYRAKNAQNARPDGTGLGLFMAKKVIIAQGGAIIFKSTEGKGSTFGFMFPKAHLLPKAAPKAELASR